jgi:formamidopyrimidine-DNA glycosylase
MPELPEVETIASTLRPSLIGREIIAAQVRWPRTIAAPSVSRFRREIKGQVIQEVARRAKFLHIRLTGLHLLIHLRMSGDLKMRDGSARPDKHDRLIITLSAPSRAADTAGIAEDGRLMFGDTLAAVWLRKPRDRDGPLDRAIISATVRVPPASSLLRSTFCRSGQLRTRRCTSPGCIR